MRAMKRFLRSFPSITLHSSTSTHSSFGCNNFPTFFRFISCEWPDASGGPAGDRSSEYDMRRKIARWLTIYQHWPYPPNSPVTVESCLQFHKMSSIFPQNHFPNPRHDPWWKAEQWRYEHPVVATKHIWRHAFPGLGYAVVAFGIYCTGEAVYNHFNPPNHTSNHDGDHSTHNASSPTLK